MDIDRPAYGWLGPYAQWVQSNYIRRLITGVFFTADAMKYVLFVYFFTYGPENDTAQARSLKSVQGPRVGLGEAIFAGVV